MSLANRVLHAQGVANRMMKAGSDKMRKLSDRFRRNGLGFALRNTDINDLRSVCVMLGPHRNLTSLISALMFLHPRCQVLNHGEPRILGHPSVAFLEQYTPERMQRFIRFAIDISVGCRGGSLVGGSILKSKAFSPEYGMREVFDRSGGVRLKPRIQCLLWKGGMWTSNHIDEHRIDVGELAASDSRLRFLMTVRNPIDIALSTYNHRDVFFSMYPALMANKDSVGLEQVLDEVLRVLHRGLEQYNRYPQCVFVLYEDDFNPRGLDELRCFLDLDEDPQSLGNCFEVLKIMHKV